MNFTILSYIDLLRTFQTKGYKFIFFGEDTDGERKEVILRHDVDLSLHKALEIAKLENSMGIKSTFFVLIGTAFYNPFLKKNREIIQEIQELGHCIGLHFDVANYKFNSYDKLCEYIDDEVKFLSSIIGKKVQVISFHRPVKELLNKQISSKIISAYENRYFEKFTYVSDSRFKWKTDPYALIESSCTKIQCLTHPIWYSKELMLPSQIINQLIQNQNNIITQALTENIRDFEDFIGDEKLCSL